MSQVDPRLAAIAEIDAKIQQDPENHMLYCERSGLLAGKQEFQSALADALKAIELDDNAAVCWVRKGAALKGLYHNGKGEMQPAHEAFVKALEIDPSNDRALAGAEATGRRLICENCRCRNDIRDLARSPLAE